MALIGEAGEFGTLKIKAKRLVCGEVGDELRYRTLAGIYKVRSATRTLARDWAETYCSELGDFSFITRLNLISEYLVVTAECALVSEEYVEALKNYESLRTSYRERNEMLGFLTRTIIRSAV